MKYCPACERRYDNEMRLCGVDGTSLKPYDGAGAPVDPLTGRMIKDRYVVIKKLGDGGMGSVYLAEQVSVGRKVAIKLLQGSFAKNHEFVARFHREARLAATLNHRNIVTIFDFDQDSDDTPFIAMEYVDGQKLADIIRRDGPLDVNRALNLAAQIAEGLNAAHQQGVIHRDVKPDNIMISKRAGTEEVKLMDFGIARLRDSAAMGNLTRTGMIMGTPAYMAPEQADGLEVSESTDTYSFGIVLYEMLSGSVPFKATTPGALLIKHIQEMPVALRKLRREVPALLEQIVMQALEKKPEKRQRNMLEIAQELRRLASPAATDVESTRSVLSTTTVVDGTSATMLLTRGSWRGAIPRVNVVNRKYWSLAGIVILLSGALVIAVSQYQDASRIDHPSNQPVTVVEPVQVPRAVEDPMKVPPPSPPRTDPPPPDRLPAVSPPVFAKPKQVGKPPSNVKVQERLPPENYDRDPKPAVETKSPVNPIPDQSAAAAAKVQEHIKSARVLRERGDYAEAAAELARAKSLNPTDSQVEAEIQKTKKACAAERKLLGGANPGC